MGCTHDCSSCSSDCKSKEQNLHEELNKYSSVKKVIGIVSGKGGVGKSLVKARLVLTQISQVRQFQRHSEYMRDAEATMREFSPLLPKRESR